MSLPLRDEAALLEALEGALEDAVASGAPVGVLVLGDREGDAALRLAAAAALQALPPGGVAGRLSEGRVAIVLPGFGAGDTRALARRLSAGSPGLRVWAATARADQPPRGPAALIADAEGAADGERLRILVVEDEPELAQIVEAFLSSAGGYDVAVAHSGAEALRRCDEAEPALLLVDLELPDVDGADLLARIRERVRDLPAVACSGKRPESAAGAGFTAFFRKPFDMRALVGTVDRLLAPRSLGVPRERC